MTRKPGMVQAVPPSVTVSAAADGPEHDDEGRGGEQRGRHAGDEIDRRVGCDPQILGDAVFRILVIAVDEVELVVAAIGQPA
jgi:hypothetical protein